MTGEALELRIGTSPSGRRMQIKTPWPLSHTRESVDGSGATEGILAAGWEQVAVLTRAMNGNARLFVLEPKPGGFVVSVEFAGFFVRGKFITAQTINNSKHALELWEAYEPQGTGARHEPLGKLLVEAFMESSKLLRPCEPGLPDGVWRVEVKNEDGTRTVHPILFDRVNNGGVRARLDMECGGYAGWYAGNEDAAVWSLYAHGMLPGLRRILEPGDT